MFFYRLKTELELFDVFFQIAQIRWKQLHHSFSDKTAASSGQRRRRQTTVNIYNNVHNICNK